MAAAISEGFKTCPEALILRNIEKTQKRCKKVLTEGWGCGTKNFLVYNFQKEKTQNGKKR